MVIALSRWFSFAVMLSLLIVYFKGGTLLVRDAKESVHSTKSRFCMVLISLMAVMGLTILATQLLICIGCYRPLLWVNESWAVPIGMLLTTVSVLTGYWCRFRYLGDLWSGNVVVKKGQKVVEDGPYRFVRHPIYATTFGIYAGISLAFAILWNLVICVLMVISYILLARYEDTFLIRNLPGYLSYCQRVRYRMIPGIW